MSWRNPPVLTIALILLNLFIFAVFQQSDDEHWERATRFYFESELARLEREFYLIYRPDSNAVGGQAGAEEEISEEEGEEDQAEQFNRVRDARFLDLLYGGRLVPENDARMSRWRQLRSEYDALMDEIVSYTYGFKPAYPAPLTLLTSMFLHGGWGHLIGNMVFLWLIGCLIEHGCRHIVFPAIYLSGGAAGTGLFWLLNQNSITPLIGASGAIAGIMGAFAVLYGIKKVRIFLNLGFYFNYLQFAAIWLLPLWMSNELLQMIFNSSDPIAYAAHFGGLGFGALAALAAQRIPGFLKEDEFEAIQQDKTAPLLEKALSHMGALNFSEARTILEHILANDPDHLAALQHIYTIDRQDPRSAPYHAAASRLLALLCRKELFENAASVYLEYIRNARPPRLSADLYIRVSQCLIAVGNLAEARRLVFSLVKKAPDHDGLAVSLYRLHIALQRSGRTFESQRCLDLLQKTFPMSDEAGIAAGRIKEAPKEN
jgi:membrane associated rhomboid family serine protease